eukprot:Hpha_TRINITY_DN16576_c0_g6::TRINITY_DN16576_c0_g6_i1::g.133259::m.133259
MTETPFMLTPQPYGYYPVQFQTPQVPQMVHPVSTPLPLPMVLPLHVHQPHQVQQPIVAPIMSGGPTAAIVPHAVPALHAAAAPVSVAAPVAAPVPAAAPISISMAMAAPLPHAAPSPQMASPPVVSTTAVAAVVPQATVHHQQGGMRRTSNGEPKAMQPHWAGGARRSAEVECKVVLLVEVRLTDDVTILERETEKVLGKRIVRSLPVWNKLAILAELESSITLPSRRVPIGTRGICALASPKENVRELAMMRTLNVRFFIMHPVLDYKGTPEQIAGYESISEGWRRQRIKLAPGEDFELGEVLEWEGGERWEELAAPTGAKQFTEQEPPHRRMYVQVFFDYKDIQTATRAAAKADGEVCKLWGQRVVIRTEYAKPNSTECGHRRLNPSWSPTSPKQQIVDLGEKGDMDIDLRLNVNVDTEMPNLVTPGSVGQTPAQEKGADAPLPFKVATVSP